MEEQQMDVKTYLLQDRQWPRELRIAHAQFQLKKVTVPEEFDFWKAVLEANES
jgi:hypothetical protein